MQPAENKPTDYELTEAEHEEVIDLYNHLDFLRWQDRLADIGFWV